MLKKIFSVRNQGIHKVITILGIKFKFKAKKLIKRKGMNCNSQVETFIAQDKHLSPHYLLKEIPKFFTDNINSTTVLIPVYNGTEHLKKLMPSLVKNTPNNVQIIIIDDCSPDAEVQKYLQNYADFSNIKIIKNNSNLGFVKTMNKGMSLINTKYAVWLNTDTIVPKQWIERLLYPFDGYNKIATTTPFTNSGCTFSFPIYCEDNEMVKTVDEIDQCFQRIHNFDTLLNETYSGTGFCMGINMECWKEIGQLDEKNFGKGYGEENDWCFRALRKGWKHYLVPNLFVQHCHGGSFLSEEKKKLIENHLEILKEKYPQEMNETVPRFMHNDQWSAYRNLVSLLSCNNNTILIIDLNLGSSSNSGAYVYRQDLINKLKKHGHDIIIVQYERNEHNVWSIIPESCSSKIKIKMRSFSEIKFLLDLLEIKKIIINNLAFLEEVENTINILCELKKIYSFHLSYKFHDHLSVCPAFFLINSKGENCEITNKDICKDCLAENKFRTIQRTDIKSWRNTWLKLFKIVDEFNFFSEYTYNKVKQVYPIVDKNFNIVEHTVEYSIEDSKYSLPASNDTITFAFVGNYCYEKGAHYFEELANLYKTIDIPTRFIIIGKNNYHSQNNNIKYIQPYSRKDLGKILTDNNVHLVVYPSIGNETFSYVAQELMQLNVPIVVFNNGAPQERIRKYYYQLGQISNDISVEGLFNSANCLLEKVYSIKISK